MPFQTLRVDNNIEVVGQISIGLTTSSGTARTIQVYGSGANIDLNLVTKGTGVIKVGSGYAANIAADADLTNRAYILTVAKTYTAKQSFQHDGTNSGIRLVPVAGPPSSLSNGDIWYDLTLNKFRARQNGSTVDLIGGGGTALLQREVTGTSYTIQNSDNGYVIYFTNVSGCDVTYPNTVNIDTEVTAVRANGAGPINFLNDGTSVLFTIDNTFTLDSEKTAATFLKKTSTDWYGFGAFISGGGGGGSGTVTSVALSAPSFLSVSGSPITNSGTLTLGLTTQNANKFFVGPSTGADASPTFRLMVLDDIPDNLIAFNKLIQSNASGLSVIGRSTNSTGNFGELIAGTDGHVLRRNGTTLDFGSISLSNTSTVSGTLATGNGGTGLSTIGTSNQILGVNNAGTAIEYKSAQNGLIATGGVLQLGGTMTAAVTVITTGFGIIFSGGTIAMTTGSVQLSVAESLGIVIDVGSDALGDIHYRNNNGVQARLGVGSVTQILGGNNTGTIPEYKTVSNGLTSASTTLKLGGALTADTTISGSFGMIFTNYSNSSGGVTIAVSSGTLSGSSYALAFGYTCTIGVTGTVGTRLLYFSNVQTFGANNTRHNHIEISSTIARGTFTGNSFIGFRYRPSFTGTGTGFLHYSMLLESGNFGMHETAPTARFHIAAGTATAGTAPLKLNTGTPLSVIEDGAFEYHTSHLYFSIGSTRYQLDQQTTVSATGRVLGRITAGAGPMEELTSLVLGNTSDSGTTRSIQAQGSGADLWLIAVGKGASGLRTNNLFMVGNISEYTDPNYQNHSIYISTSTGAYSITGGNSTASILSTFTIQSAAGVDASSNNNGVDLRLIGGDAFNTGTHNGKGGDILMQSGQRRTTGSGLDGKITIDGRTNAVFIASGIGTKVITSSAGSLTLDRTGIIWVFTGTTTTWTLPAVSGNTDITYFIKNRGSGNLTLQRAGSDNIYDTATQTSILIAPGQAYMINNDGTYWIVL
jgi:hypothetical protein